MGFFLNEGLYIYIYFFLGGGGGVAEWQHSHLPPLRSECVSQPDLKWESWELLAIGQQFTVQNLDQLYVLVSSAH